MARLSLDYKVGGNSESLEQPKLKKSQWEFWLHQGCRITFTFHIFHLQSFSLRLDTGQLLLWCKSGTFQQRQRSYADLHQLRIWSRGPNSLLSCTLCIHLHQCKVLLFWPANAYQPLCTGVSEHAAQVWTGPTGPDFQRAPSTASHLVPQSNSEHNVSGP